MSFLKKKCLKRYFRWKKVIFDEKWNQVGVKDNQVQICSAHKKDREMIEQ